MNQEEIWARELRQARERLVSRVREAMAISSPTRRYALYQDWRKEIGDVAAREQAKFVEAVRSGRISLKKIEDML
jgi:hypothetical protein